jgi:SAM-dependent methyltransferase
MSTPINVNHPFFESPRHNPCTQGGWRAQFACPTGKIGWMVGQLMAIKNAGMNKFAVEALDLQPDDRVLEIGFGHGKTIQSIAGQTPAGFVAGVDISHVMVRQATKRNRAAIQDGRVEVCLGSVSNIPYEYARFNKILAVNNYQFWPNPEHNLNEIQRVLCEDGSLVLCLRLKDARKSFQLAPGFTWDEVEEVVGLVRWVGFHEVRAVSRHRTQDAVCVVAKR